MRLLACLIVAPQRGYDEPATLSYAISSFCPTSADGLHRQDPARIDRGAGGKLPRRGRHRTAGRRLWPRVVARGCRPQKKRIALTDPNLAQQFEPGSLPL